MNFIAQQIPLWLAVTSSKKAQHKDDRCVSPKIVKANKDSSLPPPPVTTTTPSVKNKQKENSPSWILPMLLLLLMLALFMALFSIFAVTVGWRWSSSYVCCFFSVVELCIFVATFIALCRWMCVLGFTVCSAHFMTKFWGFFGNGHFGGILPAENFAAFQGEHCLFRNCESQHKIEGKI